MDRDDLVFGDDAPKDNPWQDDRLGFAPFAKRIFNVVVHMRAPNGYVIGLHGKWGSGKSTVLNFVDHYLRKHNEEAEVEVDRVTHTDFRPWNVSGHQDLIVAFFKVLSEDLGPKDSWWRRKFKGVLRFFGGTTDGLVDAAATVALTVDPSGVAAGFAGNLAKKSVNSLLDRFLEDPSLQTAYSHLREQLKNSGRRFLITIDDIDRLQPNEVRDIMQMVKTVGRLPNVIYLLAYDREIVWEALDGTLEAKGPRYAEKIVQQELELPLPSRNALFSILDNEIQFLTGNTEDRSRWQWIVREGVHRWVQHPRDVLRLSNAVKFAWPALAGEFDAQDLLVIEGLRLFDPIAFDWIRTNRDFLFNEGRFLMSREEDRASVVAAFKKRLPEEAIDPVMRLLSLLFPSHGKFFERHHVDNETYVEAHNRRGLSNRAMFDTYFALHLSPDALPAATLTEVFSSEDPDVVFHLIRPYVDRHTTRGRRMIGEVLGDFRSKLNGKKPPVPKPALLDALFRVGETIHAIPWSGSFGMLEGPGQLQYLIRDILKAWGAEEAGLRLVEAFKSHGAAIDAIIYYQRGRELDVFPNGGNPQPVISRETFEELGTILVQKIRDSAATGGLASALELFWIERAWVHLTGPDEAKAWIAENIESGGFDFYSKVVMRLSNASSSERGIVYVLREAPDPALFDLDQLIEIGQQLLSGRLSDEQRHLIQPFVDELVRVKAGHALRSVAEAILEDEEDD